MLPTYTWAAMWRYVYGGKTYTHRKCFLSKNAATKWRPKSVIWGISVFSDVEHVVQIYVEG